MIDMFPPLSELCSINIWCRLLSTLFLFACLHVCIAFLVT